METYSTDSRAYAEAKIARDFIWVTFARVCLASVSLGGLVLLALNHVYGG